MNVGMLKLKFLLLRFLLHCQVSDGMLNLYAIFSALFGLEQLT